MYLSRCANDAAEAGYGDESYWRRLDDAAIRHAAYYRDRGDEQTAALMLTQTLSEALAGNDGE